MAKQVENPKGSTYKTLTQPITTSDFAEPVFGHKSQLYQHRNKFKNPTYSYDWYENAEHYTQLNILKLQTITINIIHDPLHYKA